MRLDFLGTGAGNFRGSRRQPSSTLLEGLLLDCGAGTTGKLYDLGRFNEVDAILVSHLHSDHVAGLLDFLLHTLISGRKRPLTILSPPGLRGVLNAIFEVRGTVIEPSKLYEFRVIEGEGHDVRLGPWTVRSVPLDHSVPDLGYLVTKDDVSVFYTGDTREPSPAQQLKADYLIHEATFADRNASFAKEYGHSTGTDAAMTALKMGARRLFLNHLGDLPGTEEEIPREARRTFPDSTVVEDRQSYEL